MQLKRLYRSLTRAALDTAVPHSLPADEHLPVAPPDPAPEPATTKETPMPEQPGERRRNNLSLAQQIKVNELLSTCITVVDDGLCCYTQGMDDQQVADRATQDFGFKVTRANVVGIRRQLYGELTRIGGDQDESLARRIARLERAFCRLADRLGENPSRLDCERLIDSLLEE